MNPTKINTETLKLWRFLEFIFMNIATIHNWSSC